jgi:hypothetical protein
VANRLSLFLLLLALSAVALASGPVVGVAVSPGKLQIDRVDVEGNSNLFEGSRVAAAAPARIDLSSGARLSLGAGSQARVFRNRLVLEQGEGAILSSAGARLEALGFQVAPAEPSAQAHVAILGGSAVQVSALNGHVAVRNTQGLILARLNPGSALSFEPSSGSANSLMKGVLRSENGRFLLLDETTNLNVELRGAALSSEVGRRVEVSGQASPSADNESQVILVTRLNRLPEANQESGNRRASGAPQQQPSTPNRPASGGGGGGGGMSAGAKVAIVAAIGGGAAVGAWAATKSDESR